MTTETTPACGNCQRLQAEVDTLRTELEALRDVVAQLQRQLAAARKDSSNSSKPPSSDIVKPPKPSPPPGQQRRQPGGQPGHTSHQRVPFPPEMLASAPADYLLDLKGYDAAAQARRLKMPMLFLQGERDFQVTMTDFGIWRAALSQRENAAFRTYPKLNHLFIAGELKSSPAEYRYPGNVDPEVIGDIATWLFAGKK